MESQRSGHLSTSLLAEENSNQLGVGYGSRAATTFLVFTTFIAVCGSYVFGSIAGYSSPAETGIMEDLGLSVAEYSVFGSIMTLGAMLGAVTSGRIADLVGRKGAMGISGTFCFIGWLAIIFSKSAWLLDIGRLFTGCGVGLISYVVPVYIAEVTPKNLRGGFTSAHQLMLIFGSSVTYFLGTAVSWRVLALIGTIPCVAQLLGLFIIPESPRWLAKIGREKEYETALQRLRGVNADISEEATDIKDYIDTLQQLPRGRILEMFQRIYARSLTVGIGLMLLQQLGGCTAIVFYASSIFEAAGFSTTIGTITMAIVQIPATIFSVLLMDKAGRRPLLMASTVGTCSACLLVGLAFSIQDIYWWKEFTPAVVFVGLLVYMVSLGMGLGGIPWLIMSEIFPINIKGSAGSLASLVNWLTSFITTYLFNFVMEWSPAGTFFIFGGIGALNVVFVAKLLPETKGRTLEEIEALMNPVSEKV